MDIVNYYNWRYATKKFNSKKKVAPSDLELIKEAVRLAPSSYGLQLFKVIIIEDQELKEKLVGSSYNQNQIIDCSHLFVFCNYTKVLERDIDLFINTKSKVNKHPVNELQGYGSFLKNNLLKSPVMDNKRFIILDDVELFNINSINALLKVIDRFASMFLFFYTCPLHE